MAAACSSPGSSEEDPAPPGGVDAGSGDQDAGPDEAPAVVRVVMMGDTGTGTEEQLAVAAAVRDLCEREGCDFVVLLAVDGVATACHT